MESTKMGNLFNPDTFLSESAGGPLSTERVLIPANTYSNCYIKDLKPKEGIIKEGDRAGEPWARLNVVWVVDDEALREELGRREIVVTQGIMLDLDAGGGLDTSKG